jgi:glycerol-3-phosphate acyltransferase PlsY
MQYAIPAILGYLLGTINPAALFGRVKKVDLRNKGTKNLGATNTALILGKKLGFVVMFFDIFKGCLAVIIAKLIFAETAALSGLIAGASAVIGHMFPFYMKFKGGKGLAAYGGMVLAYDPVIFLILFLIGIICMLAFNYCVALTVSAASLFPVAVALKSIGSPDLIASTVIAAVISAIFILRHRSNIIRSFKKQEPTTKFFLQKLFEKAHSSSPEDEKVTQEQQ